MHPGWNQLLHQGRLWTRGICSFTALSRPGDLPPTFSICRRGVCGTCGVCWVSGRNASHRHKQTISSTVQSHLLIWCESSYQRSNSLSSIEQSWKQRSSSLQAVMTEQVGVRVAFVGTALFDVAGRIKLPKILYWPQSVKCSYLLLQVLSFLAIFCNWCHCSKRHSAANQAFFTKNHSKLPLRHWRNMLPRKVKECSYTFLGFIWYVWLVARKSLSKYPWELIWKVSCYIPTENVRPSALQSDAVHWGSNLLSSLLLSVADLRCMFWPPQFLSRKTSFFFSFRITGGGRF